MALKVIGVLAFITACVFQGGLAEMQVAPSTLRLSGTDQTVTLTCSIPSTATVHSVYYMTMSRFTSSQPYQEQTLASADSSTPQATLVPASEGGLPANSATVSGGLAQKSIQVILTKPDCKDAGVYRCSISYNSGTNTKPAIINVDDSRNLTVTVPPGNITTSVSPDNEIYVANTTVEILCNAIIGIYNQGTKNTVQWMWEYNDPMYGWRTYTQDSDIRKDEPTPVPGTCYYRQVCYLKLLLSLDDSGRQYRCSVDNNGDKDTAYITLGIVNEVGHSATQAPSTGKVAAASASVTGAIVGGVIGGLILLAIVIVLVYFLWYRKRDQGEKYSAREPEPKPTESVPYSYPPASTGDATFAKSNNRVNKNRDNKGVDNKAMDEQPERPAHHESRKPPPYDNDFRKGGRNPGFHDDDRRAPRGRTNSSDDGGTDTASVGDGNPNFGTAI